MNRTLVLGIALFFAIVGIALLGGQNAAVAGHGCGGGCNGDMGCDGGHDCGGGCWGKKHRKHRHRKHGCGGYNDCCGQQECAPAPSCCGEEVQECAPAPSCDGAAAHYEDNGDHGDNGEDAAAEGDDAGDEPAPPDAPPAAPKEAKAKHRAPYAFRAVSFRR